MTQKLALNSYSRDKPDQLPIPKSPSPTKRTGSPPAHVRLYAQGLFLKHTKDQAHKSFGPKIAKRDRPSGTQQSRDAIARNRLSIATPARQLSPPKAVGRTSPRAQAHAPVLVPVSRRASSPFKNQTESISRPIVDPILHAATPYIPCISKDTTENLIEQVNVLKAILGLSDDDVKWKVESAKGNAFIAADQHLEEAEERYDRLCSELQHLTMNQKMDKNSELSALLKDLELELRKTVECDALCAELEKKAFDASDSDQMQVALASERLQQSSLRNAFDRKLQVLMRGIDEWRKAYANLQFSSAELNEISSDLLDKLNAIPDSYPSEDVLIQCQSTIHKMQLFANSQSMEIKKKELEIANTIRDMEVWKMRRENSKEYRMEILKQEQIWKMQHQPENSMALNRLRSYLSLDIHKMSVEEIIESAWQTNNVLYTFDLAAYLKTNRFIHWTILHEYDIARDNFLSGDSAQYFTNLSAYDITECRAICASIPESFEFDKESKKMSWRVQFLQHVQILVKQQRCEKVKAGWNASLHIRGEIALKPLQDKQLLNPIYAYPSDAEIAARLEKFRAQQSRLLQKKHRLEHLENVESVNAKQEYLATAEDARDEQLQKIFGKEKLVNIREQAKANVKRLCKEYDALKSDICQLEHVIRSATPSYEQYLEEVEKIQKLDFTTRMSRIPGPYSYDKSVIQPRVRATARKMSVEQEAEDRKQELRQAIADRGRSIQAESKAGLDSALDTKKHENTIEPKKGRMEDKCSPHFFRFLENHFTKIKRAYSEPSVGVLDDEKSGSRNMLLPDPVMEPLSDALKKNSTMASSRPKSRAVSQLIELNDVPKGEEIRLAANAACQGESQPRSNFLEELARRAQRHHE